MGLADCVAVEEEVYADTAVVEMSTLLHGQWGVWEGEEGNLRALIIVPSWRIGKALLE